MIWKITFLLASYSVLIIAPSVGPYSPGERSRSNEIPQEHLEELYKRNIVWSIKDVVTLDMTDFVIDDNDVNLLSIECEVDAECLMNKKTSVEKYHQKMQAIQCVSGLYVLNVLDKLQSIMVDIKDGNRRVSFVFIHECKFYLTSMLALLVLARWDAYAWQIEMFTFLTGLEDFNANIESYVELYENHLGVSMREKVLAFVDRCVENNYLLSLNNNNTATEEDPAIFRFVASMYMDQSTNELLTIPIQYYTVSNLMLQYMILHEDFIFDWSEFKIELDTSNAERQTRTEFGIWYPWNMIDKWRLDPFGDRKYNARISKFIHLKAEYAAWFHLRAYYTLLSVRPDVYKQNFDIKEELIGNWKMLGAGLKCILRAGFDDENIYWSAINIMMVDLKTISIEQLGARETFTRNYFCRSVEDLGLASASDMNRQLESIEISKDYNTMFISILGNYRKTTELCHRIKSSFPFIEFPFVRTLLGAERNETFVMREKIKKK